MGRDPQRYLCIRVSICNDELEFNSKFMRRTKVVLDTSPSVSFDKQVRDGLLCAQPFLITLLLVGKLTVHCAWD
jgi:hypothetical protein